MTFCWDTLYFSLAVSTYLYQERDQRGCSDVRSHTDSQWDVIPRAQEFHSPRPSCQELPGRGQSCC